MLGASLQSICLGTEHTFVLSQSTFEGCMELGPYKVDALVQCPQICLFSILLAQGNKKKSGSAKSGELGVLQCQCPGALKEVETYEVRIQSRVSHAHRIGVDIKGDRH